MASKKTVTPRKGEHVVNFARVGGTPLKDIFGASPLQLVEMQEKLWDFVTQQQLLDVYKVKREATQRSRKER